MATIGSPTVLTRAGMAEWREATAVVATSRFTDRICLVIVVRLILDSNTWRRSMWFGLLCAALSASWDKGGISGCRYG